MKVINSNLILSKRRNDCGVDGGSAVIGTMKETSICDIVHCDMTDQRIAQLKENAEWVCVYEHSGVSLQNLDTQEVSVVVKYDDILFYKNKNGLIFMLGDRLLTEPITIDDDVLVVSTEPKTKSRIINSNSEGFNEGDIVAYARYSGVDVMLLGSDKPNKILHVNEILFIA